MNTQYNQFSNVKTAAALPISVPTAAAGLGSALAGAFIVKELADYFKKRWLAINEPSWKAQGEAKMWGQQGGAKRYALGQETFTKALFEAPADLAKERFISLGNKILDMPGDAYDRYKVAKKFDEIKNDPSVQAMGEAKARALYNQVARLSPDVVRKAPGSVLPAIQNALLTDSTGLRADYIYSMTKAHQALQ